MKRQDEFVSTQLSRFTERVSCLLKKPLSASQTQRSKTVTAATQIGWSWQFTVSTST